MQKYTLQDLELKDKKVFLRVDFNLPLDENGSFSDFTRLKKTLPTINYILKKGASLAIFSHLGRPKGQQKKFSLAPLAEILAQKIHQKVVFCPSMQAVAICKALKNSKVVLVENTRFFAAEKSMHAEFCESLAQVFDHYINDSFGTAHRKEASNYAIARYFQTPACGLLIKKELASMNFLLQNPERDFVAILGGAKVKDKIGVIENLLQLVDYLLLGGGLAYTFLKVMGKEVGKSMVDEQQLATTEKLLKNYSSQILVPQDHLSAREIGDEVSSCEEIPKNQMGLDIGKKTINSYCKVIAGAKTIFWNGPLGVFEVPALAKGTFAIAQAVAKSSAFQVIGGGDSILATNRLGLADSIKHISTGGGAAIEFIAGKTLPAIEVLKNKTS